MDHQSSPERAADIAAVAGLLQIGAEIGVDRMLDSGDTFSAADLAKMADVPVDGITGYLRALVAAGLVVDIDAGRFQASAEYPDRRYEAGYVSWALGANMPFIENARAFLVDGDSARRSHQRDGRRVAVSTRWLGERAFYPAVIDHVEAAGATRVADLGAGAGGLLIQQLLRDPKRSGVAVDISAAACAAAWEAATQATVDDRLDVVERSIESLVDDPGPVEGADVIQACFVMHDIVQDDTLATAVLGSCRAALAPGGRLIVVDAVSYADTARERAFSALFTYMHAGFMNVRLPTENEWREKFHAAGFTAVECTRPVLPSGRVFVATG